MRTVERVTRLSTALLTLGICVAGAAARSHESTDTKRLAYTSLAKLPDWSGLWIIPDQAFLQTLISEVQPGSPKAPRRRLRRMRSKPCRQGSSYASMAGTNRR